MIENIVSKTIKLINKLQYLKADLLWLKSSMIFRIVKVKERVRKREAYKMIVRNLHNLSTME